LFQRRLLNAEEAFSSSAPNLGPPHGDGSPGKKLFLEGAHHFSPQGPLLLFFPFRHPARPLGGNQFFFPFVSFWFTRALLPPPPRDVQVLRRVPRGRSRAPFLCPHGFPFGKEWFPVQRVRPLEGLFFVQIFPAGRLSCRSSRGRAYPRFTGGGDLFSGGILLGTLLHRRNARRNFPLVVLEYLFFSAIFPGFSWRIGFLKRVVLGPFWGDSSTVSVP